MKRRFRNANIGIAAGMVVLLVGFAFFHGNEGAMEVLALVTFAVAIGVHLALGSRDERLRDRETRGLR
jgi:hypothetical protein